MKAFWTRRILAIGIVAIGVGVETSAQTAPVSQPAQAGATTTTGVTLNSVIGTVTTIDANAKQISLKTDAGDSVAVMLDEKTIFLKVPPGEKNLDHAAKIALTNISVGDRVLARGKVAEDKKSVPARAVVVMTKADVETADDSIRTDYANSNFHR